MCHYRTLAANGQMNFGATVALPKIIRITEGSADVMDLHVGRPHGLRGRKK